MKLSAKLLLVMLLAPMSIEMVCTQESKAKKVARKIKGKVKTFFSKKAAAAAAIKICGVSCSDVRRALTRTKEQKRPHIELPEGLPGIVGLFAFDLETEKPMRQLAQTILRRQSTLSAGDRELIASYVSSLNECNFCCNSHSAAAQHLLGNNADLVQAVKDDFQSAPISDKLRSLLMIARKVQHDGRTVSKEDVMRARVQGATDQEIHDTVLIAAAFCMYNRYVDGLSTWAPTDPADYDAMGKQLAEQGYVRS